jgi:hypothetical protein
VVPHVPVCTYTCARGRYVFAERVEKKTGTKWDRDQLGRARVAEGQRAKENERNASRSCGVQVLTCEKKRISGLLWPFLAYPKKDRLMYDRQDLIWDGRQLRLFSSHGVGLASIEPDQTWPGMWRVRLPDGRLTDMVNLLRAKDAAASLALGVLNQHREAA